MNYKPLMVLGTSSGAGKSMITLALLRIFSDMGIKVSPFKVQNMSLNAISIPGGEISYIQYLQSRAARAKTEICMNPILLKPEGNRTHIVLKGKYYGTKDASDYFTDKSSVFFDEALSCFNKLQDEYDLIIIEGAGSPAEINLKNDIANLKFAGKVGAKNLLVADIERGGVFASIVGTFQLADMHDNIGVIINKFLGNEEILKPGYNYLRDKYAIRVLGTVPKINHNLPEEDSLSEWHRRDGDINVGVIWMPHMSNLTDLEALEFQDSLGFDFIKEPKGLEWADVVIIPGSKITVDDLTYLKGKGFHEKLRQLNGKKWIIGLCGGFQMLGKKIYDYVETGIGEIDGIGLLDSQTVLEGGKVTVSTEAVIEHPSFRSLKILGYEIHVGKTVSKNNFSMITKEDGKMVNRSDGAYSDRVIGTYIHGLFDNYEFTKRFFNMVADEKGVKVHIKEYSLENEIDRFSGKVREHVDVDYILSSLSS